MAGGQFIPNAERLPRPADPVGSDGHVPRWDHAAGRWAMFDVEAAIAAAVGGIDLSAYMPKAGGTFTGAVTLDGGVTGPVRVRNTATNIVTFDKPDGGPAELRAAGLFAYNPTGASTLTAYAGPTQAGTDLFRVRDNPGGDLLKVEASGMLRTYKGAAFYQPENSASAGFVAVTSTVGTGNPFEVQDASGPVLAAITRTGGASFAGGVTVEGGTATKGTHNADGGIRVATSAEFVVPVRHANAPSVGTRIQDAYLSGDPAFRHIVYADGTHEWGTGSAAVDTRLRRTAANTLTLDDGAGGKSAVYRIGGGAVIRYDGADNAQFRNEGGGAAFYGTQFAGPVYLQSSGIERVGVTANGRTLFSSTGTLPTDDGTSTIQAAGVIRSNTGFNVNGGGYASGTFTTNDGKLVTISGGIVQSIV